mgnify:CR=1 FL=1
MEAEVFAILGSVIGAVGGLLGGLIDRDTSLRGQSRQEAFNERAYRHRYQWQKEDMLAAGLNPVLSYKQGAPGVPGVGGTSSNVAGAIASGVSSAVAARRVSAEIANIRADTAHKEAQGRLADEQRTVATTQHQMNDIIARGIVMDNVMKAPDAFAANEIMELIRRGGQTGETLSMLNRIRQMLGLGLIGGRGR